MHRQTTKCTDTKADNTIHTYAGRQQNTHIHKQQNAQLQRQTTKYTHTQTDNKILRYKGRQQTAHIHRQTTK